MPPSNRDSVMRCVHKSSAVCGGGPIARSLLNALVCKALRFGERERVRSRLARRPVADLSAADVRRDLL
jgi:hypothetical protein